MKYPRGRGTGHDLDALTRLIPVTDPLHAAAQALSDLTPWATAFRYPADEPLTAQPAPSKKEIERNLDRAEASVEAVADRIESLPSKSGGKPPP